MPSIHHTTTSRFAAFLLIVAGIFWLGGVNIRAVMGNNLLQIGTLEFEEYIAPEAEGEVFRLIAYTSLIIIIGYGVVVISGAVFLATSPLRLKEHGWLLMSAILFYMFLPVEILTMYYDVHVIYYALFTTSTNEVFRELFIARMSALAGAPIIALLSYYTIIWLAVFQPLKKTSS